MEKYSGCGNTFYITMYDKALTNEQTVKDICKNDVDGLILVIDKPLTFIIYNRDGSQASMCGNGIRCFIEYCYNHKLIDKLDNEVITRAGLYQTKIISTTPFVVSVQMNQPTYLYTDGNIYLDELINVNGITYHYSLINTGVWHAVIPFDNKLEFNEAIKNVKDIYYSPKFKGLCNINLVLINGKVILKTFEHGVNDFTKACGTGSVATFVILKKLGLIKADSCVINNEGGKLTIGYLNHHLVMTGESERI